MNIEILTLVLTQSDTNLLTQSLKKHIQDQFAQVVEMESLNQEKPAMTEIQ